MDILGRQGLWASHGLLREFAEDPDWYFNNFQMNEAKFEELEMITQLIQEKIYLLWWKKLYLCELNCKSYSDILILEIV